VGEQYIAGRIRITRDITIIPTILVIITKRMSVTSGNTMDVHLASISSSTIQRRAGYAKY
jgi:hypothetical protein